MKNKRRKHLRHTLGREITEVWHSQLQQALPSAFAGALTSKQSLHDWATGIGMAVLTGLMEAGAPAAGRGKLDSAGCSGANERSARPARPLAAPAGLLASPAAKRPAGAPSCTIIDSVAVGDFLLDKYQIERPIGAGGMGVVVAAQHIHLKKRVAIKLLQPEAWKNVENVSRFIREAQLVARMQSRHVVRMFDVGTLDSGIPYMVMEYLEGKDLFEWMQESGPLPAAQAVDFIQQACEAVGEAHGLGIVHRDLKPANLFCAVGTDGVLTMKVLDFGISKVLDAGSNATESPLTQFQVVLGSPPYMSPEQTWSTRDVDERTDIWSLGVILYEMLTGDLPFHGRSDLDLRTQIATRAPAPIRRKHPEVRRELERVVFKCLEKDREDRYASVAELAAALRPFTRSPRTVVPTTQGPSAPSATIVLAMAAALAISVSGDPSPTSPSRPTRNQVILPMAKTVSHEPPSMEHPMGGADDGATSPASRLCTALDVSLPVAGACRP